MSWFDVFSMAALCSLNNQWRIESELTSLESELTRTKTKLEQNHKESIANNNASTLTTSSVDYDTLARAMKKVEAEERIAERNRMKASENQKKQEKEYRNIQKRLRLLENINCIEDCWEAIGNCDTLNDVRYITARFPQNFGTWQVINHSKNNFLVALEVIHTFNGNQVRQKFQSPRKGKSNG